jgi:hypothetical protein
MAAKYWIYGDRIVMSTNFGVTWTNSGAPINGWSSIASSVDGRYLIAGTEDIPFSIFTSTDAGGSWTTNDVPSERWWCVASSAGGTKLIAGSVPGNPGQQGVICTSTNSGASWISNNVPDLFWSTVASSADGCKLVAATFNGQIYTLETTPAPVLNITSSAMNVLLSWIVPSTTFVLQVTSDITSGVWSEVDVSPTLNLTNLNYEVRLPVMAESKFFRLATK